jgi:hypothetical protein
MRYILLQFKRLIKLLLSAIVYRRKISISRAIPPYSRSRIID